MTIIICDDGVIKWKFYKKSYRKARWRKLGQRLLNDFLKQPGVKGIIFVKWKG